MRILRNLILVLLGLVLIVLIGLATPPGQAIVAGVIERTASRDGLTVSIRGLSGWPPFWVNADTVTLADAEGEFAEIQGLAVQPRLMPLLTGSIALESLDAAEVTLTRYPNLQRSGSGGEAALVPFAAERFSIARLNLGEAIAGRAAELAVNGLANVGRDGSVAAQLSAERIDGLTGTLAASFSRASTGAPLTIDIDLREGVDGVLLGLMDRDSGPAYQLTARTGVVGDTFDGTLSLVSDGSARFDGRFSLAPVGNAYHLKVDGTGNLAELLPAEYASLLGGQIDIAVDADWETVAGEALPHLTIRRGTVSTAALSASAMGTYSATVADLNLTLDAANPDGAPITLPFAPTPTRVDGLSLTGKVAPSGDVVRVDLVGRVAGLDMDGTRVPGLGLSLAVETAGADPLAGGRLPFALRAEADALQTATGRIDAAAGEPLVLTADGTFDTATMAADARASLAAAGGTASFRGNAAASGLDGDLSADFADLSKLSPIVGRAISGAIDATANGTFGADRARFTTNGTAIDFDFGEPTVARLLGGVTGFSGAVDFSRDGIALTDARVDGISFDAAGSFSLSPDAIDASLDGGIADLSLLADRSSGAATFTARISGAPGRPDVDATVSVAGGMLAGQRVEDAVIGFKGAPNDAGWQGALTLSGDLADGPLSGTADVSVDRLSGLVAFPRVDLAVGGNRITGAVERTAAGPLSGALSVDAPDIGTLAALALADAKGSGRAELRFAPDGAKQSVSVSFSGSGVSYGTLTASSIGGEAVIDDAFGVPLVRGNATASALDVAGLRLDSAEATATSEGGATRFDASARGPDVALTGGGSLTSSGGAPVVRIDALNGIAFRLPVALNQPVTIRLDRAGSRISGATLALGGGTVQIDGAIVPALDLIVTVTRVSASVVDGLVPGLGAEGSVSGRATVKGQAASPSVAWSATWAGLRIATTRSAGLPPLSLSAQGNATRTATSLDATLTATGFALAVTGQAPFAGSGLNLRANGDVPLALLAAQSGREVRLAGTARVNLGIAGALASPAVSGTIDIVNATFADIETGFGVVGANGRLNFDGRRATVQSLSGRMGQGGEISVAGSVNIDSPGLPAALTIRVGNGRYSDGHTVSATFNADLSINGPLLANGVMSGRINLLRSEILLSDRMGSAGAIEVTHINTPAGFVAPLPNLRATGGGAAAPARGGGLGLNIELTSSSGVFVRGFGIDSEFGGSLTVAGTTGNPQPVGAMTMRWGRMELLGRRFQFTRGTLTFAGDLTPVVDFAATTRAADVTVTLSVSGPADDLDFHFTSSPQMPEEEIISYLLFQRSVGRLSALQALQLVDAVAQLTGTVGQGGMLARIRQATGLDDLDIQQTATGGTAVGIGRRINENLRLGVEAGTQAGSGRVVIDLDITSDLKAQAEAGQDGSGSIGLTYEREY